MPAKHRSLKCLSVSSGGGHWIELRRLRPAYEDCDVTYVTTVPEYKDDLVNDPPGPSGTPPRFICVPDSNQWSKLRLLWTALIIGWIILRVRPDVVVSTGAAPGYFAIRFGRMIGARTIWVDSIANAEQLSLSGVLSGKYCDLWLTQWDHLAYEGGPVCRGQVM